MGTASESETPVSRCRPISATNGATKARVGGRFRVSLQLTNGTKMTVSPVTKALRAGVVVSRPTVCSE